VLIDLDDAVIRFSTAFARLKFSSRDDALLAEPRIRVLSTHWLLGITGRSKKHPIATQHCLVRLHLAGGASFAATPPWPPITLDTPGSL
jgi:hypothetical protein